MGRVPPNATETTSDPAYNSPYLQSVPILHSTPPHPKGEESCTKAQPKPLPHGPWGLAVPVSRWECISSREQRPAWLVLHLSGCWLKAHPLNNNLTPAGCPRALLTATTQSLGSEQGCSCAKPFPPKESFAKPGCVRQGC